MQDKDTLIRRYSTLHSHLKNDIAIEQLTDNSKRKCWINPKARLNKKNKNFYAYTERDFSALTHKLHAILDKEEYLKAKGYNLDGIKSFNRNVWFDISKNSVALEGIFEDYPFDLTDLRTELRGKFAIDPKGKFSRNDYFVQLHERQQKMIQDNDSIVVNGKNQKHSISLETAMHYMAFKYIYKCAKHDKMKNISLEELFETMLNASCLLSGERINSYRKIQVYVKKQGYSKNPNWTPTRPNRIDEEIEALLNSVLHDEDVISLHPLVKAAMFHAEFVRVHPFIDGNGRTGRLMSNYILIREEMPAISIASQDLDKYHDAISTAIEDHNLDLMIDLFYDSMQRTIEGIDKCLNYIEKEKNIDYENEIL